MSYLYINEQGAAISVDGGQCVITTPDEMKRIIPIETVEYISLFGNIHITMPAIHMFMENKIPVTLYSKTGAYYGRIMSNENVSIMRQRKQFALSGETDFALNLSKKIIKAKIHNQAVVLGRYCPANDNSDSVKECIKQMKYIMGDIDKCTFNEQLMGYEGIAARYYFKGLGMCVVPQFEFSGRSRRPPQDEFNAMLSFGYSILMNEIYGAVEGKGINVYAGFLHHDRENHPTVASDLMEEWRSVIVDSAVMSLVNGYEIKKDGFTRTEEGIFLNKDTFKIFIRKYENKMRTDMNYLSNRMSFRRALFFQASMLAKAIDEEDYTIYNPIEIR